LTGTQKRISDRAARREDLIKRVIRYAEKHTGKETSKIPTIDTWTDPHGESCRSRTRIGGKTPPPMEAKKLNTTTSKRYMGKHLFSYWQTSEHLREPKDKKNILFPKKENHKRRKSHTHHLTPGKATFQLSPCPFLKEKYIGPIGLV
jgi:hypothetical protein